MDTHNRFLGLRSSAIIEGLAIVAILALIDVLVFNGQKFVTLDPHPFWVVVLLLAAQYGANEGIFAAALATIAYLIIGTPEAVEGTDRFDHLYNNFINPILWFFTGWLLGEMRARHVRERHHFIKELDDAHEREQLISDSYEFVKTRKEQLEVQIAGQLTSTIEAYKAAKDAESLDPNTVMQGVEKLISTVMAPQKFSLYLLQDSNLNATIIHGWQPGEALDKTIPADNPLYQAVVGQQQLLLIANSEHERALNGQGLLAGPLVDSASGEVIGMLKIEQMDFISLGLQTVESFKAILQWVSSALINARHYQTAKNESVINPERGLLTYGYFKRQSEYLSKLAKRIGFDLSTVTIKINDPEMLDDAAHIRVARQISASVKSTLRGVDLAFDHQTNGNEFSILLPATPTKGAQIVRDKIAKDIEENLKDVHGVSFNYIVQAIHETA